MCLSVSECECSACCYSTRGRTRLNWSEKYRQYGSQKRPAGQSVEPSLALPYRTALPALQTDWLTDSISWFMTTLALRDPLSPSRCGLWRDIMGTRRRPSQVKPSQNGCRNVGPDNSRNLQPWKPTTSTLGCLSGEFIECWNACSKSAKKLGLLGWITLLVIAPWKVIADRSEIKCYHSLSFST